LSRETFSVECLFSKQQDNFLTTPELWLFIHRR
jgi:hypothetical protein